MIGDDARVLFDDKASIEDKKKIIFEYYKKLVEEYDRIRNPVGTKDAPAKTCRDLSISHPDFKSGMYWIDPNEGDSRDAIQVYCDMRVGASCITPSPKIVPNKAHYIGKPKHTWFSEMPGGSQFTYKIDRVQLTFLQMLSGRAEQNITYHCKNSVAYLDATKGNYRKAVKLLSGNDLELKPHGDNVSANNKFTFTAAYDGCKDRKSSWDQTMLTFKSDKPNRLPVVDIAPKDIGGRQQQFGLEIGPACFL